MNLYALKKTLQKPDDEGNIHWDYISVSRSLPELVDLRDRCIEFELQDFEELTGDRPGGPLANIFMYDDGLILYDIEKLVFDDDFECDVKEAELKTRIVRGTSIMQTNLDKIGDYGA